MFAHLVAATASMVAPLGHHAKRVGVFWDVDGTLVESTTLAFDATNEVLEAQGREAVTVDAYKFGCRFTTPERFNYHMGLPTGDAEGARLGDVFDSTYVARVSPTTAGLFDGMRGVLEGLARRGHPLGALSNACGAYVRAVVTANDLHGLMEVQLGADEVKRAKPHKDGLRECCERLALEPSYCIYVGDAPSDGMAARAAGMRSIGVLWGANDLGALRGDFDLIAADVAELELHLSEVCEELVSYVRAEEEGNALVAAANLDLGADGPPPAAPLFDAMPDGGPKRPKVGP